MSEEKENKAHEHKGHDAHKHVYMEHKQHNKNVTYKTMTLILGIVSVALLIGLILALTLGGGNKVPGEKSMAEVKTEVDSYIKGLANNDASVDSITDVGGLYALKLTVAGMQYDSYASKDGKLLFPQGIDLTQQLDVGGDTSTPAPTNVPKSDKPVVELFVMSHCPYGTQSEKGMLPVARTLGDKIDFKIRFVYYAMHGALEVNEQVIQYCIQDEQSDKFIKYLACFLNSTDGGSAVTTNNCLTQANVDKAKLENVRLVLMQNLT
jgi:hypothetical protein